MITDRKMKHNLVLEPNKNGEDYIVGDVHGHYDFLLKLLDHVKFDKEKDRLISVGDMIDRGDKNIECLELLYEPWFFMVLGNHEQCLIDGIVNKQFRTNMLQHGGFWYLEWCHNAFVRPDGSIFAEDIVFCDLLNFINDLPLSISIKQQDGTYVHVIHAELPLSALTNQITDEELINRHEVFDAENNYFGSEQSLLWSRRIFDKFYDVPIDKKIYRRAEVSAKVLKKGFANIGLIVSGHTPVKTPIKFKQQINIDTGAYYNTKYKDKDHGLTILRVKDQTCFTVSETNIIERKPLDVFANHDN